MRKIACEQCVVRDVTCIADLPADRLDEFRSLTTSSIYKRRQVVFHEGTPANGLYIVCLGAVKLYQSDRFGREHILDIARPGDVIGEVPLDPAEAHSVSAEVLVDSQLCFLPRERLVAFMQIHPMTGVRLVAALSRSLSAARRKVRSLALKRAESRLADLLIDLAGAVSEGNQKDQRIVLGYSRRELAEMIGVSTETAIRMLGRLKHEKTIATNRRELVILDADKLARIAHRDDLVAAE